MQILISPVLYLTGINSWEGAQTALHTILTTDLKPGAYYLKCAEKTPHNLANDQEKCKLLWDNSMKLLKLV